MCHGRALEQVTVCPQILYLDLRPGDIQAEEYGIHDDLGPPLDYEDNYDDDYGDCFGDHDYDYHYDYDDDDVDDDDVLMMMVVGVMMMPN